MAGLLINNKYVIVPAKVLLSAKKTKKKRYFSHFSTKTFVVGTHKKPFAEALLLSTDGDRKESHWKKIKEKKVTGKKSQRKKYRNLPLKKNEVLSIFLMYVHVPNLHV